MKNIKRNLLIGACSLLCCLSLGVATATLDVDTNADTQNAYLVGASVSLTDDIIVKIPVTAPAGYTNAKIAYNYKGANYVQESQVVAGEQFVFEFDKITPQNLTENVAFTLELTGEGQPAITETISDWSIKTYCDGLLSGKPDGYSDGRYEYLKALTVNLLNYGEKAQAYKGKDGTLPTDGLSAEDLALVGDAVPTSDAGFGGTADASVTWNTANLEFNNKINLVFGFTATANGEIGFEVDGKDTGVTVTALGSNKYQAVYNVPVVDFDEVLTLTVTVDGVDTGYELYYSVASYASRIQSNANANAEMKALALAAYNYGLSAAEFDEVVDMPVHVAEVSTIDEFNTAMADTENIDYIRFVDDITFENFTLTRDITIEGIVTANSVVLENDANVTLIGRLNNFVKTESPAVVAQEDSIFEISGSGTLEIETVFNDQKPGSNGDMDVYTAGVFSTSDLKISGVKLVTTGLHVDNGDLTVDGNADVIINGPGYVGSSTFNGVEVNNGVINVDEAKFAVMFNGKEYVNRAAIQCMGLTVTNGATLVVDKTENADFHYGFAMWQSKNYVVTVNGGSTAKFNATKIGNQTDNQCFSNLGTLNVTDGATFEMNALRYFNGTVNGKFDSDVNITVNGVVLDMSKSITDMKFGEMGMTNCEIGNQPGSDVEFFVGDTYNGEGLTVNALFENSNISGKLSIEFASGYEIEAEPFKNGWNTIVVKVGEKRVSFTLFAKPKDLLTVQVSTVEDFKTKLADETVGTIIMDGELTFDTLEINRDITIEGNMKVTTLTVSEGVTLFTLGRIWSDANMTINGKGTVNAMLYTSNSGSRQDHAAIRVGGTLDISEATVICSNLSSVNTVTIDSGANVTVYGKTVVFQNDSLNGIHVDNGDIIISGADTVLNVLFNDTTESKHPAALQANSITVDGATLIVGAAETKSNEWGFAIWFNGSNTSITATNGAQITFTITKPYSGYSVISGGNSHIYVQEGQSVTGKPTSFTVIAPSGSFYNSQVKEGNVTVMTPEQA